MATNMGEKMKAVTESGITILLNENGTWAPAGPPKKSSAEGFRKASWGTSISEVKASEDGDPRLEQDDYLDFEVRLGRFSCLAAYNFVRGQLVRGKYLVIDEYQNKTRHITDYDELKTSVTKKYGAPISDATHWLDDLYKDDYSQWGMAIGCGHLSKFANWETPESTVNVAMYGENFDVTVSVEYAGKAFESLESSVREAEFLGDL